MASWGKKSDIYRAPRMECRSDPYVEIADHSLTKMFSSFLGCCPHRQTGLYQLSGVIRELFLVSNHTKMGRNTWKRLHLSFQLALLLGQQFSTGVPWDMGAQVCRKSLGKGSEFNNQGWFLFVNTLINFFWSEPFPLPEFIPLTNR